MDSVYVFEIIQLKKFIFASLSIKRFHPYFELLYFRHGKAVWSSKLSFSKAGKKIIPSQYEQPTFQNPQISDVLFYIHLLSIK